MWSDPAEMLCFVDDDLLEGRIRLYPWQLKIHKDFAVEATAEKPYQATLRTCNGAGKDRMIIAPCAMWLCSVYQHAVAVITSASGTQLDRQTNAYIKQLCESINTKFGAEVWKINYRHYENLMTNSVIELFVTDESGRAEGWHPQTHGGQLAIFTSEAKSIPDDIFRALARCTGYTKRLDCSTPGLPIGHFYKKCHDPAWKHYHVTAFDCPHIPSDYIQQCRADFGEDSALYKSMILAEFASQDNENTVIPYHSILRAIHNTTHISSDSLIGGLDLSAGADETVLALRNGNKVTEIIAWRVEDTSKTIDRLNRLLREKKPSLVFADVGGLGNPILWELRSRYGWDKVIKFVDNRARPRNRRAFYNRGVELWFTFAKYIENLIIPNDDTLVKQLASRRFKIKEDGTYILESKLQMRARGLSSPDRADAVVLAFTNYEPDVADENKQNKKPRMPQPLITANSFTIKDYAKREANGITNMRRNTWTTEWLREQLEEMNLPQR